MPDQGAQYANMAISEVEKRLRKTYGIAQKELASKLASFNRRFAAKDREKQRLLNLGKITKQDYKDWLSGQVFVQKLWKQKIDQVTNVMQNFGSKVLKIIKEKTLNVFADNYNRQAYETEKKIVDITFTLHDKQSVERLITENPKILPEWKIDEEKDYIWNYNKVNNIVQQGIIQGESIDQIAERLCRDLCSQNEKKMRMFARTAITGAQNAGRQQQMEDAAKKGIDVNKKWIATLDSRTRDAHRHLDGQEVPYDQSFKSDLGAIRYPGDPDASPANVYNCRCTMVSVYPKYANRSRPDRRQSKGIDGMSYEEWKKGKQRKK